MTSVPELRIVSNELDPVKLKWREIGQQLGIVEEQFKQCTHPEWFTNPAELLCEILDFWLKGNTSVSPTWESVVTALESLGEVELSQQLREKHCRPSTRVSDVTPDQETRQLQLGNIYWQPSVSPAPGALAARHVPTFSRSESEVLDDKDWSDICRYLDKLDRVRIEQLGGELGLSVFNLDRMQNLPDDMVKAWLRKEDRVIEKSGDPLTWSILVVALRKIGQNGISDAILTDRPSTRSTEKYSSLPPPDLHDLTIIRWKNENGVNKSCRVISICPKWYEVGIMLGMKHYDLTTISMRNQKDPMPCCIEVLTKWLKDGSPHYPSTWEGVFELLDDLDETVLSSELQNALLSQI